MTDSAALLHHGGAASAWHNLGCWDGGEDGVEATDYATACAALADRVAAAAALGDGDHVLSLGCGAGEELLHWLRRHGAASVVGIEQDARLAQSAHRRAVAAGFAPGRITVLAQSALPQHSSFAPERFDVVLCVDAAHSFAQRVDWLLAAHASLRPGGRLAYTDFTVREDGAARWLLRRLARPLGIAADELASVEEQTRQLDHIGYHAVSTTVLDDAVLGGHLRFVAAQTRRLQAAAASPAWRAVRRRAAVLRGCRALGLGYALLAARKPD